MGWTFSSAWPTASAMRDHLRDSLKESGYTVLDDALTNYGRHYYATVSKGDEPATIFVALLDNRSGDGWGYKDMGEEAGPYVHDCPLRLLAKAGPPPTETAAKWRESVRAHHARRSAGAVAVRTAKRGDKVWLTTRPEPYTVSHRQKNSLVGYRFDGAGPFRLQTSRIVRFEPAAAEAL